MVQLQRALRCMFLTSSGLGGQDMRHLDKIWLMADIHAMLVISMHAALDFERTRSVIVSLGYVIEVQSNYKEAK